MGFIWLAYHAAHPWPIAKETTPLLHRRPEHGQDSGAWGDLEAGYFTDVTETTQDCDWEYYGPVIAEEQSCSCGVPMCVKAAVGGMIRIVAAACKIADRVATIVCHTFLCCMAPVLFWTLPRFIWLLTESVIVTLLDRALLEDTARLGAGVFGVLGNGMCLFFIAMLGLLWCKKRDEEGGRGKDFVSVWLDVCMATLRIEGSLAAMFLIAGSVFWLWAWMAAVCGGM